jgi:DNA polymerase III subunit delta'
MSGLPPLIGHDEVRAVLAAATRRGELRPALLFHGPPGIGKQRLGLWLAQLLVCTERDLVPCDRCQPCRLARQLEHPDVHWFFPLPRPKVSGSSERLGEALEELRADELASRRAQPLYGTGSQETVGIYLAHVQVIRRVAVARPAMGRRKVFLIGDAESLVPQEASPEAANALLKLLEEPPADTTVILTATDPDDLLATIRSRLLPIRLRPLPEPEVAAFLVARGTPAPRAQLAARVAQGSIGRAAAFLAEDGDEGERGGTRQEARAVLEAALAGSPTPRLRAALGQAPAGARGGYAAMLGQLSVWLRDLAAVAAGAEEVVINVDAIDWLRQASTRLRSGGAGVPAALVALDQAAKLVQFNINPQLALNALVRDMALALRLVAGPGRR